MVTNEQGVKSEPDSVMIYVFPEFPPTANAGLDQTADSGDIVQLNGTGSFDPFEGTLTYKWIQSEEPEVTLSDSTVVNPTFTAPNLGAQDNLVFQLVVTNEQNLESPPDSVTITVNPSDNQPTPPLLEGIIGSGNNVNIQIQENSGNNVGGQSDFG